MLSDSVKIILYLPVLDDILLTKGVVTDRVVNDPDISVVKSNKRTTYYK